MNTGATGGLCRQAMANPSSPASPPPAPPPPPSAGGDWVGLFEEHARAENARETTTDRAVVRMDTSGKKGSGRGDGEVDAFVDGVAVGAHPLLFLGGERPLRQPVEVRLQLGAGGGAREGEIDVGARELEAVAV